MPGRGSEIVQAMEQQLDLWDHIAPVGPGHPLQRAELKRLKGARLIGALRERGRLSIFLLQLDLSAKGLGDTGAVVLARVLENDQSLRSLRLAWNKIGDCGAEALADALAENSRLTALDLGWNCFGDAGCTALARALRKGSPLQELVLDGNNIGDSAAASLALALRAGAETAARNAEATAEAAKQQELERAHRFDKVREQKRARLLGLGAKSGGRRRRGVKDSAVTRWAKADAKAAKKEAAAAAAAAEEAEATACVAANDAAKEAARRERLADGEAMFEVVEAEVAAARAEAEATARRDAAAAEEEAEQARIAACRGTPSLRTLRLAQNRIGDEGATALAAALDDAHCPLRALSLPHNTIGARGGRKLGPALAHNTFMRRLDLRSNNLRNAGSAALGRALGAGQGISLRRLDLAGNCVGDEGAAELAAGLSNNFKLRQLNLASNDLADEGARALAPALARNYSLGGVDLSFTRMNQPGLEAIDAALAQSGEGGKKPVVNKQFTWASMGSSLGLV